MSSNNNLINQFDSITKIRIDPLVNIVCTRVKRALKYKSFTEMSNGMDELIRISSATIEVTNNSLELHKKTCLSAIDYADSTEVKYLKLQKENAEIKAYNQKLLDQLKFNSNQPNYGQ